MKLKYIGDQEFAIRLAQSLQLPNYVLDKQKFGVRDRTLAETFITKAFTKTCYPTGTEGFLVWSKAV
jgi:hypothetical protein